MLLIYYFLFIYIYIYYPIGNVTQPLNNIMFWVTCSCFALKVSPGNSRFLTLVQRHALYTDYVCATIWWHPVHCVHLLVPQIPWSRLQVYCDPMYKWYIKWILCKECFIYLCLNIQKLLVEITDFLTAAKSILFTTHGLYLMLITT